MSLIQPVGAGQYMDRNMIMRQNVSQSWSRRGKHGYVTTKSAARSPCAISRKNGTNYRPRLIVSLSSNISAARINERDRRYCRSWELNEPSTEMLWREYSRHHDRPTCRDCLRQQYILLVHFGTS